MLNEDPDFIDFVDLQFHFMDYHPHTREYYERKIRNNKRIADAQNRYRVIAMVTTELRVIWDDLIDPFSSSSETD